MFPDSNIAQQFSLGKDKAGYYIHFGLAPFIKQKLVSLVNTCPFYVLLFDEALNRISQKEQMDIHVRFWHPELNEVHTRYFNSVFLGHTKATDLLGGIKEGLETLSLSKISQISMDGPNVNWKLIDILKPEIQSSPSDPALLELGSCGLHILHGSYETGLKATGWQINSFLSNLYYLFKDSPARRADYSRITGSALFAKKFCATRWLDNTPALERALNSLPHFEKYINEIKPKPSVISFQSTSNSIADKFLKAKLEFLISIASILEPFLRKYQSSAPLIPFLFEDLEQIIHGLFARIIKPDILSATTTTSKLLTLDISATSPNFLPLNKINIGFGAKAAIKIPGVGEDLTSEFLNQCRRCIVSILSKIIERSPLNYALVRACSALSPHLISTKKETAFLRFDSLLQNLHLKNHISSVDADKCKNLFQRFCTDELYTSSLKSFEPTTKLDHFYTRLLQSEPDFAPLFDLIKRVLTLSHGNASVESGFSCNENILVENLKEQSLISHRIVYDYIHQFDSFLDIPINKELLQYCRLARSRYHEYLDEEKKNQSSLESRSINKRKVEDQIRELEAKKSKLNEDHAIENSTIDSEIRKLKFSQF